MQCEVISSLYALIFYFTLTHCTNCWLHFAHCRHGVFTMTLKLDPAPTSVITGSTLATYCSAEKCQSFAAWPTQICATSPWSWPESSWRRPCRVTVQGSGLACASPRDKASTPPSRMPLTRFWRWCIRNWPIKRMHIMRINLVLRWLDKVKTYVCGKI